MASKKKLTVAQEVDKAAKLLQRLVRRQWLLPVRYLREDRPL